MRNKLLLAFSLLFPLFSYSQTLQEFLTAARTNSPLLKDYANQAIIQQEELARLQATLTRSRLEMTGDYLFVPVISKDGGGTTFKWNAQDGTDYYGYDLGESSGHLHAGLTWTQPLLGRGRYNAVAEQSRIEVERTQVNSLLEQRQLERSVTELYLLCLADKAQMAYADTLDNILHRQRSVVERLVKSALVSQSDLRLLDIELQRNDALRTAARQSLHTHSLDLQVLCGVSGSNDTLDFDEYERIIIANDTTNSYASPILTTEVPQSIKPSLLDTKYRMDSLAAIADLNTFKQQYRPQLNLFVSGGLQTGSFSRWAQHFGWSAGLTFSWTLYDGHAFHHKSAQTERQLATIAAYRSHTEKQRRLRLTQCLAEARSYDERAAAVRRELADYATVLKNYEREIQAGHRSVLDYITLLKSREQAALALVELRTNQQLALVAYNYWNK